MTDRYKGLVARIKKKYQTCLQYTALFTGSIFVPKTLVRDYYRTVILWL